MYIDTLTVAGMFVVMVPMVMFVVRCVFQNCSAPCEDKVLCGDDVREDERSWPL